MDTTKKLVLIVGMAFLAACGTAHDRFPQSTDRTPEVRIAVKPSRDTLVFGESRTFRAYVTGPIDVGVEWSLKETENAGSINRHGLYTAPDFPGTFHLIAASRAHPEYAVEVTVDVRFPDDFIQVPPVINLLPNTQRQLYAVVPTSPITEVTWSTAVTWTVETPDGGTIDNSGLYTAPDEPGTYHLRAWSEDGLFSTLVTASVTHTPMWVVELPEGAEVNSIKFTDDGRLYGTGTVSGVPWLFSFDEQGQPDLSIETSLPFQRAEPLSNGDILAAGQVTARLTPTGAMVWAREISQFDGFVQALTANDDQFILAGSGRMAGFHADGTPEWGRRQYLNDHIDALTAGSDGNVYVGNRPFDWQGYPVEGWAEYQHYIGGCDEGYFDVNPSASLGRNVLGSFSIYICEYLEGGFILVKEAPDGRAVEYTEFFYRDCRVTPGRFRLGTRRLLFKIDHFCQSAPTSEDWVAAIDPSTGKANWSLSFTTYKEGLGFESIGIGVIDLSLNANDESIALLALFWVSDKQWKRKHVLVRLPADGYLEPMGELPFTWKHKEPFSSTTFTPATPKTLVGSSSTSMMRWQPYPIPATVGTSPLNIEVNHVHP